MMLQNGTWTTAAVAVPYFLAAAGAFILGLLTPLRRRESPTGTLFQGIAAAASVWFASFGVMALGGPNVLGWARVGSIAAMVIPALLYQFTAVALGITARRRLILTLFWAFTISSAAGVLSTLVIRSVERSWWGWYPRAGIAAPYVLSGVAVILAGAFFEYWRQYRKAHLAAQSTQMRAWAITFAVPLIVLADALPAFEYPVYPVGFIFVLLFFALAVFVFREHWLVSITPSFAAREIVDTMVDGVIVCDAGGRIQVVNQALLTLTGYTEEQLSGEFLYMFLDPEATLADSIRLKRVLSGEKVPDRETAFRDQSGKNIDVSLSIGPIRDPPTTAGAVVIVRDIRERKDAEEILRQSEERYRHFVERNLAGVFRMAVDGTILDANDAFARIVGCSAGREVTGCRIDEFLDDPASWQEAMRQVRENASVTGVELSLRKRDGSQAWVLESASLDPGDGEVVEGTMIDITERKAAAEQIEFQAYHDPLTGLPNRRLFIDRLTMAIAHSRRSVKPLAVMFVDLDRFKSINDTFGHSAGDLVLVSAAERIAATVRATDTVARVGGDELVVLLSELRDASDAGVVAQKIIAGLDEPVSISSGFAHVSASIGVALFPVDGDDPESLIKNADGAMYRAKEAGRNNFKLCTPEMKQSALDRVELEQTVRRALLRNELLLYYQPIIDLETSRISGIEALLRWNHPERGLLLPDAFIAVAEDTNLILPIGRWVIRTAFEQLQQWRAEGLDGFRLAINLSPRQFQQPDLPAMIAQLAEQAGVAPTLIELEITENTAMFDLPQAIVVLEQLRKQGMQVAIDDFGIGYSSLNHLNRLPIDSVKIDRTFVRDLAGNPGNSAIVDAIITIARTLGLRVVAEGIETEEELAELTERGCHEAQGYLFSRAVPAREIAPLIRSSRASKKPLRAAKPRLKAVKRTR